MFHPKYYVFKTKTCWTAKNIQVSDENSLIYFWKMYFVFIFPFYIKANLFFN